MKKLTDKKRIVVKIGSSSLTSRNGEISLRKLDRLVDEIALIKEEGHEVVLVSSGAVAAGYRKLGLIERPTKLAEKQAAASIGQCLLMEAYSERFISHGYIASQILITRSDFSDQMRYMNARNTIQVLLERGVVPIVNENDTITIKQLKFGDNDTLSAKVAGLVEADELIILSDIDGLYDDNPKTNPEATLLEEVREITPEIEAAAGDSNSDVGTGGMSSKIDAVKISLAAGIETFIGDANKSNILSDAVHHSARGTYFKPDEKEDGLDVTQHWIAFNSGSKGEVIIDDGARVAITEEQSHLLPQGVREVNGDFDCGDVVVIRHLNGEEVGRGVINYSAEQLRKIKRLKLNDIPADIKVTKSEAIRQDEFVCVPSVTMS
ncbi:glutamate 5-kinase [Alkalihalophilus pseudofirmus]|uniref:Glutamate 5-kinase n=1 Tax=Alkalihalophilus pseudofirmus TaxID=79885 RepID=A0AAJ2KW73_ALKPS|nr:MULTISPECIES: glutamate 5-kinase [Alkalihalophilus]MDV2885023.1 glutamate 5-kinase [Alkalihalophilus pseudofirmus]MEC2072796.1 glutamate 5-kinase [Alkalihalophilus marmarensis]MED1600310.1 glutamate 5-kinase [Alkalihalophilus marmarensis]OLS36953.1 glutamate 5-kinase [Alkalihalophilus pseudofirmus]WEG15379.1 glutamate 5-kinase [Alkalihalophilus pseudofirmus]